MNINPKVVSHDPKTYIRRLMLLRTEAVDVPDARRGSHIIAAIDVFLSGLGDASDSAQLLEWVRRYDLYARQMITIAKHGSDSAESRALEAEYEEFESEVRSAARASTAR